MLPSLGKHTASECVSQILGGGDLTDIDKELPAFFAYAQFFGEAMVVSVRTRIMYNMHPALDVTEQLSSGDRQD